jgi:hypothetical protein
MTRLRCERKKEKSLGRPRSGERKEERKEAKKRGGSEVIQDALSI